MWNFFWNDGIFLHASSSRGCSICGGWNQNPHITFPTLASHCRISLAMWKTFAHLLGQLWLRRNETHKPPCHQKWHIVILISHAQKVAIKWFNYVKIKTRCNYPKSLSTSLQVGALVFYVSQNLLGDPKFVKDLFELHNRGNTSCNNCLKQPNHDVLGLPSGGH